MPAPETSPGGGPGPSCGRHREAGVGSPEHPTPQDDGGPQALWISGYGSLVWRPDFTYSDSCVGFMHRYSGHL
ncbi:hypothetical protein EI555_004118 [Monodon monoceros]|uniref:Gamma-glutamylcyclotransferase n=1 Tax=Monodon monoceros TaxID=40151 RepID=A0A4U1EGV7_MONMO|nr:hypothetical protein EI555_004118 [Monodon monoceros]